MKILKLKNYHVQDSPLSLQAWLLSLDLDRKPSRTRTRFVKMTLENAKEIEAQRQELIKKYGKYVEKKVTKDGKEEIVKELERKIVKNPTTGQEEEQILLDDTKGYSDEFAELLNEDFIIDVTPAIEVTINGVKDIVLSYPIKVSGKLSMLIDEWCEAFESIAEAPETKPETAENTEKEEAAQ